MATNYPLIQYKVRSVAATGDVEISDEVIISTAGAGITLTLPAAAVAAGRVFYFKAFGAGAVTVEGNAAEQVEGAANDVVAAGAQAGYICDGTAWYLFSA